MELKVWLIWPIVMALTLSFIAIPVLAFAFAHQYVEGDTSIIDRAFFAAAALAGFASVVVSSITVIVAMSFLGLIQSTQKVRQEIVDAAKVEARSEIDKYFAEKRSEEENITKALDESRGEND